MTENENEISLKDLVQTEKGNGIVNISYLNLRAGPGIKFGVVNVLKEGDEINILGDKFNNWIKVSSINNEGWVAEKYIIKDKSFTKNKSEFKSKDNLIRDIYSNNYKLNLSLDTNFSFLSQSLITGNAIAVYRHSNKVSINSFFKFPILYAALKKKLKSSNLDNKYEENLRKFIITPDLEASNSIIYELGGLRSLNEIIKNPPLFKTTEINSYLTEGGTSENYTTTADINSFLINIWFSAIKFKDIPDYKKFSNIYLRTIETNFFRSFPYVQFKKYCDTKIEEIRSWLIPHQTEQIVGIAGIFQIVFGNKEKIVFSLITYLKNNKTKTWTKNSKIFLDSAINKTIEYEINNNNSLSICK